MLKSICSGVAALALCAAAALTATPAAAFKPYVENPESSGYSPANQADVWQPMEQDTSGYTAVVPTRLVDTRSGLNAPEAKVQGGQELTFKATGFGPIPAGGVKTIVFNVTVTEPEADGFISLYAGRSERPVVSHLNFVAGQTIANQVAIPLSSDGAATLYTHSTAHVIVDSVGYLPKHTGYINVDPTRVLDTRADGGQPVLGGQTIDVDMTPFMRDIDPARIDSMVINVTSTQSEGPGFVTVYPSDIERPLASNLNINDGETIPAFVIARTSADGKIRLYTHSTSHLIVDVFGVAPKGYLYQGLNPVRFLDTREGQMPQSGETLELKLAGRLGIPRDGVSAVVVNITTTEAQAPGYVTAYPHGITRPKTSNINYSPQQTVANSTIVPLGNDGTADLYVHGTSHVIVDVQGYLSAPAPAQAIDGIENLTCALNPAGQVLCWGENGYGQLGRSTNGMPSRVPAVIPGIRGAKQVSVAPRHSCAVTANDQVACWGDNSRGQLGIDPRLVPQSMAPIVKQDVPGKVVDVANGTTYTCALNDLGQVFCWGTRLGPDNEPILSSVDALKVRDFDATPVDMQGGDRHLCVLLETGAVQCWGGNIKGQLGLEPSFLEPAPVSPPGIPTNMVSLSVGSDHTCAIDSDGGMWCWGDNTYGQSGSEPREPVHCRDAACRAKIDVGGRTMISVSSGTNTTCASAANGDLICAGEIHVRENDPSHADGAFKLIEDVPPGFTAESGGRGFVCGRTEKATYCFGDPGQGHLGRPGAEYWFDQVWWR